MDSGLIILAVWIIGFLCGMLARNNRVQDTSNLPESVLDAVKYLRALHDIKTGSLPPDYQVDSPENIRNVITKLLEINTERKSRK